METGEKEFNTHANEGTLSYSKSVGSVTTHFNFEAYANLSRQWGKHDLNPTFMYSMDKI